MNSMISRAGKVALVLSGGILLSGWFLFVPLPGGSTLDERLAKFAEGVAAKPQNNAVAVAKDPRKWAWGGAEAQASPEAARSAALDNCRAAAARDQVEAPCQTYAVNGAVVSE